MMSKKDKIGIVAFIIVVTIGIIIGIVAVS